MNTSLVVVVFLVALSSLHSSHASMFILRSHGGASSDDQFVPVDPKDDEDALLARVYENYLTSAKQFRSIQPVTISKDYIYVSQREFTIVPSRERIEFMGTQDATTCHMIILRHRKSNVTLVSHFDGADTVDHVRTVLERMRAVGSNDAVYDLYVVGGYLGNVPGERRLSEALSRDTLWQFSQQASTSESIYLRLACISRLNDVQKTDGTHWPVVYGCAINLRTADVFPASFAHKGPELPLRMSINVESYALRENVYDVASQTLRIQPFSYSPASSYVLTWSDAKIRERMSTSPLVEPPDFSTMMREAIRFGVTNPDSGKFFGGKPLVFTLNAAGDAWIRV